MSRNNDCRTGTLRFCFIAALLGTSMMEFTNGAELPKVDMSSAMAHRTNFCTSKNTLQSSTSPSTVKSLNGITVNVGVDRTSTNAAQLTFDAASGQPNGGIVYQVMKQISKSMGVTVQYVQLPSQKAGQSNSQYIIQMAPYVDIVAPYLTVENVAALASRVLMSPPIVVSPTILVSSVPPPEQAHLWNFLTPFSFPLWGLFLGFMVLNGVLWWLCREQFPVATESKIQVHGDEPESEPSTQHYSETSLVFNLFYSINTMSGEKAKADNNVSLRLMTISFNFMIVVVVSAYTANLATLLLAMAIPPPPLLGSIDEANKMGSVVCMLAGSANVHYTQKNYPRVRVLEAPYPDFITNINDGMCSGALMYKSEWGTYIPGFPYLFTYLLTLNLLSTH